jgi:hypothetical protein
VKIDSSGAIRVAGDQNRSTPCTEFIILKYLPEPSGVNDLSKTPVNLFPNPSDGTFSLVLDEYENGGTMQISDATGRIIYAQQLVGNEKMITVDLLPGIYFANFIFDSGKVAFSKLIIQ